VEVTAQVPAIRLGGGPGAVAGSRDADAHEYAEVSGNATGKQADLLRTLAYGAVALSGIFC